MVVVASTTGERQQCKLLGEIGFVRRGTITVFILHISKLILNIEEDSLS